MLDGLPSVTLLDVRDYLNFCFDELEKYKQEFKDKEARKFFELARTKYQTALKDAALKAEKALKSEEELLDKIKDIQEFKDLKNAIADLIFFFMREKGKKESYSTKVGALFNFLNTKLK